MQKTKKNHNNGITVQDLFQYILSCQVKHLISGLVLFIATFSLFTVSLDRFDSYLNNCNNKVLINPSKSLVYWAYGKTIHRGYLKHVFAVLDRLGYINDPNATDWDLLWAHDYPFRTLQSQMLNLKPYQKVNHFPGCGFITNKVDLSISNSIEYLPRAFKLPGQKNDFLQFSKENPNVMYVQKSNDHRGIKICGIDEIDFNNSDNFIQEYVSKPFLVDGYKFDIGVYTIITSIDPLRIYIYTGDVLFRYCPEQYYPFDPDNLDKYVVGDDYLPTWDVPSLKYFYNTLGLSMKDSFDGYVRSVGKDPVKMWLKIEDAIRISILSKEEAISNVLQRYKSKRNFFEMMRFDFILDENLEVFLMEANMSPNLSSAHYPPNQLLYEQVIYNLFGLIGLGERVHKESLAIRNKEEELMLTADKNLMVFPTECSSDLCRNSCVSPTCLLCRPCLTSDTKSYLTQAYREHMNRQDCKRIFPPLMNPDSVNGSTDLSMYSAENQLQYRWFIGKCLMDSSWC